MGCQTVKCVECGNKVKACQTTQGLCPHCYGKKQAKQNAPTNN